MPSVYAWDDNFATSSKVYPFDDNFYTYSAVSGSLRKAVRLKYVIDIETVPPSDSINVYRGAGVPVIFEQIYAPLFFAPVTVSPSDYVCRLGVPDGDFVDATFANGKLVLGENPGEIVADFTAADTADLSHYKPCHIMLWRVDGDNNTSVVSQARANVISTIR
jgi:hypothetical protein